MPQLALKFVAIPDKLIEYRGKLKPVPTHAQMAKMIQMLTNRPMGRAFYTFIEAGKRGVPQETAIAIASLLNTDINNLFIVEG